jgi:hypothetical protein
VLGESVVRVAQGAAGVDWTAATLAVAVGTEYTIRDAAGGQLERSTAAALGGGTALYLLSTAVTGLAVRRGSDRRLPLWLGAAAVSLAAGLGWPLGFPVGLLVALDLVLGVLVTVEARGLQAEPAASAEAGAGRP